MKYPNINAEMARLGLNRTDLANKLGVSRKTVYNWLTKGQLPLAAVVKLADLFGKPVDYLLGRSE